MSEDAHLKEKPEVERPSSIPDSTSKLLCALAYGWTPEPMQFGRVEKICFRGIDLSDGPLVLEQSGSILRFTAFGQSIEKLLPFPADGELEGTLSDGARVHASSVLSLRRNNVFSRNGGGHRSLLIELGVWSVIKEESPSMWVGLVEGGSEINFSGNLVVERRTVDGLMAGSRRHFFIEGEYDYFFVQFRLRDRLDWYLVIDTKGVGAPEREALERDFLALEFVLGRQLRMPLLFGLGVDRRTVACTIGCGRRSRLETHSFSPEESPHLKNSDDKACQSLFTDEFIKLLH